MRVTFKALFLTVLLHGLSPAWAQAQAQEGVDVGSNSGFARLVPAEDVERSAEQEYRQLLKQAADNRALAPENNPQLQRLRRISQRIIPYASAWNPRAQAWKWEVNLIGLKQINAFCMPGGKIGFYTGILNQLQLTDDEIAAVMGHEMAHALREHVRSRMGKTAATSIGANLLGQLLGLGSVGQQVIGGGAKLLVLKFSREDESEADLVGLELAARAGFDPRAGITLWQKMEAANKNAPPQWMSTHPASGSRIAEMERVMPRVVPLYERARKS